MVKKIFCDKCGKEISDVSDSFDEVFESVSSNFKDTPMILKPHLCWKCQKGYEKIIKNTNREIKKLLSKK